MVTVPVLFLLLSAFSPLVHSLTTFHVILGNMNQTEAQEACTENYTNLVTVYSDEDNTKLDKLIRKENITSSWIGLSRGQFNEKWSNGDPVTFINVKWDSGSLPCCAAVKADGGWERLQCTEPRYFMCYEQDASSQTPKYHLILQTKTWYEAQSYCRRNYTDLVSIRDHQHNEEVKSKGLKNSSNTPFWIGMLWDDWQWTDGGNSIYRNWDWNSSQSSVIQLSPFSCVVLSGGRWLSVPCSDKHPALCYNTSIHVSEVTLSWEKALDYCQEKNRAGLLQIESKDDQTDVVKELRRGGVNDPVWVGLRQSRLFGFWIWPDGKAVFPYSNWDEGKQPEHQLSQHCGAVVPQRDYRWRDMNCRAQYRVLCHTKCS
ncbi:secretory phospholipase A2 receptor-like [Hemibagrus wyckioides]|nr:secretory phospholipase A2 receptor-like [Hemibagrus wyckioides]